MKKAVLTVLMGLIGFLFYGCGYIGYEEYPNAITQSPYTNEMYPAGTAINGYTLPPEPNHEENDKTIAGIDINNNGIRDDVERFVIIKESSSSKALFPKTWTAVMLQYAKAFQKLIMNDNPSDIRNAKSCKLYIGLYLEEKDGYHYLVGGGNGDDTPYYTYSYYNLDHDLILNTHPRTRKWLDNCPEATDTCYSYSDYRDRPKDGIDKYCDTNISKLGEIF
jgi:hypothetical protein